MSGAPKTLKTKPSIAAERMIVSAPCSAACTKPEAESEAISRSLAISARKDTAPVPIPTSRTSKGRDGAVRRTIAGDDFDERLCLRRQHDRSMHIEKNDDHPRNDKTDVAAVLHKTTSVRTESLEIQNSYGRNSAQAVGEYCRCADAIRT
jgi:hypothetical protein